MDHRSHRAARIVTPVHAAVRYLLSVASGSATISSATFLITLRCNCRCAFCDFPRNRTPEEMDTREVLALLSDLRRAGLFRIGLSGGEPLLREDFGTIAREVRRLGLLSSLTTNGVLLEAKAAEACEMDHVLCSVDGDQAIHDATRGKGAFRAAVAGLSALRSRGHRRLGLIMAVHRANAHAVDEVLRLAGFLGARAFFQPVQKRLGWLGPPFGGYLDQVELREVFSRLMDCKRRGKPVGNSYGHLRLVCSGDTSDMGRRCHAGRFFFTILPDGSLMPCCLWSFEGHPRLRPGEVDRVVASVKRPPCTGCTIVSYFENTRLMTAHPEAILNAVGWSLDCVEPGGPVARVGAGLRVLRSFVGRALDLGKVEPP